MAKIKGYYKDYAGSENQILKLLNFKKLTNSYKLYVLYNHLGILQQGMKEYDKAIAYYHKATGYYTKLTKEVQQKNTQQPITILLLRILKKKNITKHQPFIIKNLPIKIYKKTSMQELFITERIVN